MPKTKDGRDFVPGMTLYWPHQYESAANRFKFNWRIESYVDCKPHVSGRVEDRYGKLVYIDGCYGNRQQVVRYIVGQIEREIENETISLHAQLAQWKEELV
jgi:hypothetical protein